MSVWNEEICSHEPYQPRALHESSRQWRHTVPSVKATVVLRRIKFQELSQFYDERLYQEVKQTEVRDTPRLEIP